MVENIPEYKRGIIENFTYMAFVEYAQNKPWLKHLNFNEEVYPSAVALFTKKYTQNLQRYSIAIGQTLMEPKNIVLLSANPEFQKEAPVMLSESKNKIISLYQSNKESIISEHEKNIKKKIPPSNLEEILSIERNNYAISDKGHLPMIKYLIYS